MIGRRLHRYHGQQTLAYEVHIRNDCIFCQILHSNFPQWYFKISVNGNTSHIQAFCFNQ